jgi:PncC family amidohydrolase
MAPDDEVVRRNKKTPDFSKLVKELARRLRANHQTVGFAESCTGGLLSSVMTAEAGVSDVYMGGVVAYANHIKEDVLRVSPSLIRSMGAVSLPVARQMAEGVRIRLRTDWAVSITGIAGPSGGTPQKPVGTVCFGLRGPGIDRVEQQLFTGGRLKIQTSSVHFALELLLSELS